MKTKIRLLPLREAQTITIKEEMQEAFQLGFDFQPSLLMLGSLDASIALPSLNRSLPQGEGIDVRIRHYE